MAVENEKLLELYRKMVLTRKLEKKMDELIKSGRVKTFGHFGEGQEAVGVGVCGCLRDSDYLFGTHRGFAEYIGKGMPTKDILLEYGGSTYSPTKGKGGPDLCYAAKGIMGMYGSIGANFSIAVGTALSAKMKGTDQITLILFGEGASNQADFHPAMNMAALWRLPLVFVCENNQYVELDHYRNTTSTEDIAPRAMGYGMPFSIVKEGNDIVVVHEATKEAVTRARKGEGPTLIEFKTYRVCPHYSLDPGGYRSEEEVEAWRKRDPIRHCKKYLIRVGALTEQEDKKMLMDIDKEIIEATEFLDSIGPADRDELYEDLYA
jgi:pyruvate dehydrogenase E1 component alpha subunit